MVALLQLDLPASASAEESTNRIAAASAKLVASLAAAEAAGVPAPTLDEALTPLHEALRGCEFYRRTHTWPRGYPGDFETVEMLCYPQKFATPKHTWADRMQEFTLGHASVQQHRNKIVRQALTILEVAAGATSDTRILSAGCGGCPDLRMILPTLRTFPGRFVLVDSDADALAFSRSQLGALADSCDFIQANALRHLKRAARKGDTFDLIYAGGLFDYFKDDAVDFFLTHAHALLKPGGRLFFTNIAAGNPHLGMIKHLARWNLILRSEASLLDLCKRAAIEPTTLHIERDATGVTLLVDIKKP
ncbi:class I SAM-dependent methyltransferase [Chondromyces apiculatus]|nr:class I SAM-dependent methyltransferase [Chondromyces apiculatus]